MHILQYTHHIQTVGDKKNKHGRTQTEQHVHQSRESVDKQLSKLNWQFEWVEYYKLNTKLDPSIKVAENLEW